MYCVKGIEHFSEIVKIADRLSRFKPTWFDAAFDVCEDIARVYFFSIGRHMQLDFPAQNITRIE